MTFFSVICVVFNLCLPVNLTILILFFPFALSPLLFQLFCSEFFCNPKFNFLSTFPSLYLYLSLLLVLNYFGSGYQPCRSGARSGAWALGGNTKPSFNSGIEISAFQKRWASHATTKEDDGKISIGPRRGGEVGEEEKDSGVVYYGPISSTIKKVKLLSLSTCCLSVSLGPVITFMTSPDMNVILKGAVASSVIFLSASTTAALHWFVTPYIHKLRWKPGSDSFEVEMMSWLATFMPRTIKFSDIRPAETNRPFVTFMANGNFYFVDADHCHNKALLARLTPQNATRESAFKNL